MAFIRGYCTGEQNSSNAAPVAQFSVSCAGLTCTFDASTSSDSDGFVADYTWDFGDGSAPASGETVEHTYAAAGSYVVVLTVTDDDNDTDTDSQTVSPSAPQTVELLNETNVSGTVGSETPYSFTVPADAKRLIITTTEGGTGGDSDLYVKFGSAPTTSDYDCWPGSANPTGNEECVFVDPPAGTWHVMIHGFTAYSGLTVHAEYETGVQTLTSGVADDFLAGPSGNESVMRIEVPTGATELEFFADEADGEFSMYVKYGAAPTDVDFDYSSTNVGGNETITIPSPAAGTWFVMLKAGTTAPNDFYSRVSLTATVSTTPTTTPTACDPAGTPYTLVQGKDTTNMDPDPDLLAKPAKGAGYLDPAYDVCVVRLTDHTTEGSGTWLRNHYSRRQAFNSDNSKVLVNSSDGLWHLYNTSDFTYDKQLSLGGGGVEPQWHPSNPSKIRLFNNHGVGMVIREFDITTEQFVTLADLSTRIKNIWPTAYRANTGEEGSPSKDHDIWTLKVETQDWQPLGVITYQLSTDTILGTFDNAAHGMGRLNHVDTSASGTYAILGWNDGANNCASDATTDLGTTANPCGLMAYNMDFSTGVGLAQRAPHGDSALLADGTTDAYVISNYATGQGHDGWVISVNPGTGARTLLWDIYEFSSYGTSMHISGKNINKPGWVLITTYADGCNTSSCPDDHWYDKKVMLVELVASPRILNIAHTYNVTTNYSTEPHGSISRDATRIVYNSNWGTGNADDMDVYYIVLPDGSIPV